MAQIYGSVPTAKAIEGVVSKPDTKLYGLGWPMPTGANSPFFKSVSGKELIRGQLLQILLTNKGERVMLPNFGVSIREMLFEPFTQDIATRVAFEIETSINKYAPNIEVLKITTFKDDNLKGYGLPGFSITVTVQSRDDNQVLDVGITV